VASGRRRETREWDPGLGHAHSGAVCPSMRAPLALTTKLIAYPMALVNSFADVASPTLHREILAIDTRARYYKGASLDCKLRTAADLLAPLRCYGEAIDAVE
jgi:hypothetical protein